MSPTPLRNQSWSQAVTAGESYAKAHFTNVKTELRINTASLSNLPMGEMKSSDSKDFKTANTLWFFKTKWTNAW